MTDIIDYASLQNAINAWLARTDLSTNLPDFIGLFEAVANRRLRTRWQETTTLLTPSSGEVALPTDYLSWRRLTWTGQSRVDLQYVEPSWLQSSYPTQPQDIPRVFTIEGPNILIMPVDATPLEFVYFQKIPALSAGANWLITSHPDLYLFGALAESYGFTVDANKLGMWKARRDELFEEVIALSNKTRGAGAVRVQGPTP